MHDSILVRDERESKTVPEGIGSIIGNPHGEHVKLHPDRQKPELRIKPLSCEATRWHDILTASLTDTQNLVSGLW